MSLVVLKAVVSSVLAFVLLAGSAILFSKTKTSPVLLQLLGAGCLVVVGLVHVCEALDLFPWMGWGAADSAGHYLDLVGATIGLTLFPLGYLWHALID